MLPQQTGEDADDLRPKGENQHREDCEAEQPSHKNSKDIARQVYVEDRRRERHCLKGKWRWQHGCNGQGKDFAFLEPCAHGGELLLAEPLLQEHLAACASDEVDDDVAQGIARRCGDNVTAYGGNVSARCQDRRGHEGIHAAGQRDYGIDEAHAEYGGKGNNPRLPQGRIDEVKVLLQESADGLQEFDFTWPRKRTITAKPMLVHGIAVEQVERMRDHVYHGGQELHGAPGAAGQVEYQA